MTTLTVPWIEQLKTMKNSDRTSFEESLSAFADGEYRSSDLAAEAEVIDRICQDEEARSAWACMHLARDVMQGDYNRALAPDFASLVSESIAHEEVYAIDNSATDIARSHAAMSHFEDNSASVVSMAQARDQIARRQGRANRAAPTARQPFALWKPVAGLGLAASLAGAAFVFSQLWVSEQPDVSQVAVAQPTGATTQQQQSADVVAATQQSAIDLQSVATLQAGALERNAGTRWRTDQDTSRNDTMEERLNILLTNHLEDASMGSVNGLISHSKVVGYDSMPEKEQSK